MIIRFRALFTAMAVVTISAVGISACATATAAGKKVDATTLYNDASAKLKAGKWNEAAQLFERFTLEFPTDARYQEARFRVGEAHFGAKQYITAATEFGRLASDFPAGPYADDAQYKVCESYVRLSPDIALDQQYTQQALDQCQMVVAYFQSSEFVPRANAAITEMTDKLAHKMYWTGDYYFRRKAYDSANMYYELTAKTYPLSVWAPRALSRMIDAYRILHYDTELNATRARLLHDYPDSPEAKMKPDSVSKQ